MSDPSPATKRRHQAFFLALVFVVAATTVLLLLDSQEGRRRTRLGEVVEEGMRRLKTRIGMDDNGKIKDSVKIIF